MYIHVQFFPPGLEVHIFIDPFGFEIGGATILSIKGTNRDQTLESRSKQEESDKKRADDEKIAMVKYQAGKYGDFNETDNATENSGPPAEVGRCGLNNA